MYAGTTHRSTPCTDLPSRKVRRIAVGAGSLPCMPAISTTFGFFVSPRCQATIGRPWTDFPMTTEAYAALTGFASDAAACGPASTVAARATVSARRSTT